MHLNQPWPVHREIHVRVRLRLTTNLAMIINYTTGAKEALSNILPSGISEFKLSISSACKKEMIDEVGVHLLNPGLSGAAVFLINRIRKRNDMIPWVAKVANDIDLINQEKENYQNLIWGTVNLAPRLVNTNDSRILYFEYAGFLARSNIVKTLRDGYTKTSAEALEVLMQRIVQSLDPLHDISADSKTFIDRMPELENLSVLQNKLIEKIPSDLALVLTSSWRSLLSNKANCHRLRSTAHGDLNSGNILFEIGSNGSYPVFIDFASMTRSKDNKWYDAGYHFPFWDYAKLERDIITRLFLGDAIDECIDDETIINVIKYVYDCDTNSLTVPIAGNSVYKLVKTVSALRQEIQNLSKYHQYEACYKSVLAYSFMSMIFRLVPDSEFKTNIQLIVAAHAAISLLKTPAKALLSLNYSDLLLKINDNTLKHRDSKFFNESSLNLTAARIIPTIFISYSNVDISLTTLSYITNKLNDILTKLNIRCNIYSKHRSDFSKNVSLEEVIHQCDSVIILGSPDYRSKVNEKWGKAYDEFKIINSRLTSLQNTSEECIDSYHNNCKIIPIIMRGSLKLSVPDEFICTQLITDLSNVRFDKFDKNDNLSISIADKLLIEEALTNIAEEIISITITNSADFKAAEADISDKFKTSDDLFGELFTNTKFSSSTVQKVPDFFDKCFVETPDFEEVIKQRTYFLIGRKGSGKSTITGALALFSNQKYKGYIAISAEAINLSYLYNEMTPQTNSDRRSVLSKYTFFQVAWDGFIALCLIKLIVTLEKSGVLVISQVQYSTVIYDFFEEFMAGQMARIDDESHLQTFLFETAFDKAQMFLKSIIDTAPYPNNLATDLRSIAQSQFNTNDFLNYLFGPDVYFSLIKIITNCDKRVLVTVDNFDTRFDLLRRDALSDGNELKKRNDFEIEWLHGVMLRILDLKDQNKAISTPFSSMDFCLTIPKDRFIQIEKDDRDVYMLTNRTKSIQWSGVDLCKILIQRLSYYTGSKINSDLLIHKQLDEIIEVNYPNLPLSINVSCGAKDVELSLFCYVLRHSFWRPRDVLKIFEKLIATSKTYLGQESKLPNGTIKSVINDASFSIIKSDFLNEYKSTIPAIKEIHDSFRGKPEVFSTSELYEHLNSIDYLFTLLSDTELTPIRSAKDFNFKKQVELLFDIGFLGIVFMPNEHTIYTDQMSHEFPDHFYFNEGSRAFHRVAHSDFKEAKFIIHPIFWDSLLLKSSNSYYSLHFTWDYLYSNGALQPFRA